MITTCTTCGKCYEAGSEEQANEPTRFCFECRRPTAKERLDALLTRCAACGAHGPNARSRAASTNELATEIAAADDALDPRDVPLVALGPDSTDRTAAFRSAGGGA